MFFGPTWKLTKILDSGNYSSNSHIYQSLQANLSRHKKKCPLRPNLFEQGSENLGALPNFSNEDFLKAMKTKLSRPGSGLQQNTVSNYMNYIR